MLVDDTSMTHRAPSKRIREARERAGLTLERVADGIGLAEPSYLDLESYDAEIFMAVTLVELQKLCALLQTRLADLLGESVDGRAPVGWDEIADRVRSHVATSGTSVAAIEKRIGWSIAAVLETPQAIGAWNLEQLQDVAREIGARWIDLLPA